MADVVLDTHAAHWLSAEPHRLSRRVSRAIDAADGVVVADITWFELAWLAAHERIVLTIPILSWLAILAGQVRTLPMTPAIAAAALALPSSFPADPADRLIYASAVEHGMALVTKDVQLRSHPHPRPVTVW
jgi:PIN domain nuclease of toxin-antitoxin system